MLETKPRSPTLLQDHDIQPHLDEDLAKLTLDSTLG
jgi:hypothetical protein